MTCKRIFDGAIILLYVQLYVENFITYASSNICTAMQKSDIFIHLFMAVKLEIIDRHPQDVLILIALFNGKSMYRRTLRKITHNKPIHFR